MTRARPAAKEQRQGTHLPRRQSRGGYGASREALARGTPLVIAGRSDYEAEAVARLGLDRRRAQPRHRNRRGRHPRRRRRHVITFLSWARQQRILHDVTIPVISTDGGRQARRELTPGSRRSGRCCSMRTSHAATTSPAALSCSTASRPARSPHCAPPTPPAPAASPDSGSARTGSTCPSPLPPCCGTTCVTAATWPPQPTQPRRVCFPASSPANGDLAAADNTRAPAGAPNGGSRA
jgi:hypothetical protein